VAAPDGQPRPVAAGGHVLHLDLLLEVAARCQESLRQCDDVRVAAGGPALGPPDVARVDERLDQLQVVAVDRLGQCLSRPTHLVLRTHLLAPHPKVTRKPPSAAARACGNRRADAPETSPSCSTAPPPTGR